MLQHDKEFWLNDKTFTVRIRHDARSPVIDAVGPMRSSGNGRADQMVDLLSGIAEKLPPMNITFTVRFSPGGFRTGARELTTRCAF